MPQLLEQFNKETKELAKNKFYNEQDKLVITTNNERFVCMKVDEFEDFITQNNQLLFDKINAEWVKCLPRKEYNWNYGGGGGIDTEYWCRQGICFSIPGIKQIVTYGIKNDEWWARYLFKFNVILPEKYKNLGYNNCLNQITQSATKAGLMKGE